MSCVPKDGPHDLGSLSLLENVLLISSGCFFAYAFPIPRFLYTFSACCFAGIGGVLPHVWNHLRRELCSHRWRLQPWQSQFVCDCSADLLWLFFGVLVFQNVRFRL